MYKNQWFPEQINPASITTYEPKFVSKVWGYEKWIVNNERYCGKLLYIAKGHYTSWHYHRLKKESFYVQSGQLYLLWNLNNNIYECKSALIKEDNCVDLPIGMRHRLVADTDLYLFEFSTEHFDEDSIRLIPGA